MRLWLCISMYSGDKQEYVTGPWCLSRLKLIEVGMKSRIAPWIALGETQAGAFPDRPSNSRWVTAVASEVKGPL